MVSFLPPIWQVPGENRVQPFNADNGFSACINRFPDSHHIIAGDMNAHHNSWDKTKTSEDEIGQDIYSWLIDGSNMLLGNSGGFHTLKSKRNGSNSTPDLTLYSNGINFSKWKTLNPCTSDHIPITFEINLFDNLEIPNVRNNAKKTKYCFKKANWPKFNIELRKQISLAPLPDSSNVHSRCSRFSNALQKAGKTIPRGCREDPVPWWDDDIDIEIEKRDALLKESTESIEKKELYQQQCREVIRTINAKQSACWKEFATSLRYGSKPSHTASMVKAINREQRSSESLVIFKIKKN